MEPQFVGIFVEIFTFIVFIFAFFSEGFLLALGCHYLSCKVLDKIKNKRAGNKHE